MATSGCGATSTRVSRSVFPAPIWGASTSRASCPTPRPASATPRAAAVLGPPLASAFAGTWDHRAILVHTTKASQLTVAAAMDHLCDGPDGTEDQAEAREDLARVMFSCEVTPDRPLRVTKLLAY